MDVQARNGVALLLAGNSQKPGTGKKGFSLKVF